MKKITQILFILLLAACTGGRRAEMLQRLQALNALNRADSVLTATNRDEAQLLADYFDRHGTSNEQMLAHYLVGRCYADMHEAPMALHCYQEAAQRADTTAADCDFAQLSRVYGQSAAIFYQQGLYRNQLECEDWSMRYAWRGNDTLTALCSYAMKAAAYDQLQLKDSAILIYQDAIEKLKLYKYNKVAAGFSGTIARELIDKGETDKALPYLQDYEQHSGYFDSVGNVAKGREIYYCWKGLYYLSNHRYDSAKYYFQKELQNGKDFDNQNSGSRRLAQFFLLQNQPDSAAKYALYAYDMNDSVYAQRATHEVEQAKAMYDYSRNREQAQQEKQRADSRTIWLLIVSITALAFLFAGNVIAYLYTQQRKKRKAEEGKRQKLQQMLNHAKEEIDTLHEHESEFHKLINEKEATISQISAIGEKEQQNLQKEINELRDKEKDLNALIKKKEVSILKFQAQLNVYRNLTDTLSGKINGSEESLLRKEELYQELLAKAHSGRKLSKAYWEQTDAFVCQQFPNFHDFLTTEGKGLSDIEYKVCLMSRLHFRGKDIANFIGVDSSYVSRQRKWLHEKLFGVEGNSQDFEALISAISESTT